MRLGPGGRPAEGAACAGRDEGSAIVEFVFLAVLMLVPVVYLIIALAGFRPGRSRWSRAPERLVEHS